MRALHLLNIFGLRPYIAKEAQSKFLNAFFCGVGECKSVVI